MRPIFLAIAVSLFPLSALAQNAGDQMPQNWQQWQQKNPTYGTSPLPTKSQPSNVDNYSSGVSMMDPNVQNYVGESVDGIKFFIAPRTVRRVNPQLRMYSFTMSSTNALGRSKNSRYLANCSQGTLSVIHSGNEVTEAVEATETNIAGQALKMVCLFGDHSPYVP